MERCHCTLMPRVVRFAVFISAAGLAVRGCAESRGGWVRDVLDVPQSRLADLARDDVVSEPVEAGRVLANGQLGGERDTVPLEVPASAGVRNAELEHRHCPDVPADAISTAARLDIGGLTWTRKVPLSRHSACLRRSPCGELAVQVGHGRRQVVGAEQPGFQDLARV